MGVTFNKRRCASTFLGASSFLIVACGGPLAGLLGNDPSLTGAAPTAPEEPEDTFQPPPVGDPDYIAEAFGAADAGGKVDVLWVIDDSNSMGPDQTNLRNNIANFVNAFTTSYHLDFKLAVTTTAVYHPAVGSGYWDWKTVNGRLMNYKSLTANGDSNTNAFNEPNGYPAVLTSAMDSDYVISAFQANAEVGTHRGTVEQGLEGARLAIENTYGHLQNEGFMREHALLSIIIVSDENDQSFTEGPRNFPEISQTVKDKDDPDYYVAHYMNYFASLKSRPSQLHFTTITKAGEDSHYANANALALQKGLGSLAIQGLVNDGAFDWAPVLTHLSQVLAGAANQIFRLDNIPVVTTIKVTVDGVLVNSSPSTWFYSEADNAVVFDRTGAINTGAEVVVSYKILR